MDIYIMDNKYIACIFIIFCLVFGGLYLKLKHYDSKIDQAQQEILNEELETLLGSKLLQGSKNVKFDEHNGMVSCTTECSSNENMQLIERRGEEWLLKNGWTKKENLLFQKDEKILEIKFVPKNELKVPKEITRWKITIKIDSTIS